FSIYTFFLYSFTLSLSHSVCVSVSTGVLSHTHNVSRLCSVDPVNSLPVHTDPARSIPGYSNGSQSSQSHQSKPLSLSSNLSFPSHSSFIANSNVDEGSKSTRRNHHEF